MEMAPSSARRSLNFRTLGANIHQLSRLIIKFLWIIMMTLPLSSCKLKWQCHHNFVKQKQQPSKEEFWLSGVEEQF